ncbi:MAG TPA: 3-deoxy-D-manno-octulosonic acid transferase [Blastocatellia bacterium]|nr:3-deoxy-D-manno-octulosonic acid transferase [Blastocatellia bacterium]
MRFIYSFLLAIAFVALLPYFIYQAVFNRKYVGAIGQRLGFLPDIWPKALNGGTVSNLRPMIWIHAVSVGETLASKPLIAALRSRFPQYSVIISTTTATGQAVAHSRLPDVDGICYFPFDWRFCVRNALNVINPRIVILMESELWLNFLSECEARRIPVIVANGRISDLSFERSQKFGFFSRRLYGLITRFAMQSRLDAERAIALGAPAERVEVSGNLKFEIGAPDDSPRVIETAKTFALDSAPLIVAGSTTEGEEEMILAAFEGLRKENAFERVRLLIAPRHPERFDAVARLLKSSRLRLARRSSPEGSCDSADVILLDTVGELASLYRFASVVFVGGSLVPKGGHNILEPALQAKPIIVGPHMENFRESAREFLRRDALIQLRGSGLRSLTAELQGAFANLLSDRNRAETLGSNGRRAIDENRGATARTVEIISELLP